MWPGVARADSIDVQVRQLRHSGNYKLRLSAALKLAKTRDSRAVAALSHALVADDQTTLRRVAALSLSKMVDESVPGPVRKRAIAALERAAKKDHDSKVREAAARALEQLHGLRSVAKKAKVFVAVGKPADLTRKAPAGTTRKMHVAVRRALRENAPDYSQEWPSGGMPTKAELAKNGAEAFFVGATVSMLQVNTKGGRAEISCSVSVRVSPWSGKDGNEKWEADRAASATGNGKVIGANTRSGIAGAKNDCLLAVVEQVTSRQVVPFLKRLAR